MADVKKETKVHMLPEGRIINSSLFERDAYTPDKGKAGEPLYKIELAFDPNLVQGENTIEDELLAAAYEEWGNTPEIEKAVLDGTIRSPFLSGDELAARRADKGKEGTAYKGLTVIRANTKYNLSGDEGPGGVYVVDPDNKRITAAMPGVIYNGCYAIVAVTISAYLMDGRRGLKFYLSGVQKTRDGEKLTSADKSQLFKPIGRVEGAPAAAGARRGARA